MKIAAVIMLAGLCVAGVVQPARAADTAVRIVTSLAAWNRAQLEPMQVRDAGGFLIGDRDDSAATTGSGVPLQADRCAPAVGPRASVTGYLIGASGATPPAQPVDPIFTDDACLSPGSTCGRMFVSTDWNTFADHTSVEQPAVERDPTRLGGPGSLVPTEPAPGPLGRPCVEAPHTWAPITEAV